jgi:selenocysteine lyase/cysteine desulfurase
MNSSRRRFLEAVTVTAFSSSLLNTAFPFSAAPAEANGKSEYLFADGLTYLNTGTIGPCRRETVEESMRMWEELEALPMRVYGKWGFEDLAEKTRATAARFLGCDIGEIAITNNTTSGMNAVAQGLRLKAGDRILASNHEHGGGLHGWQYLAKYYGAVIDMITIPPAENNADALLRRIKNSITKKTKVITVSHVYSSTGLRTPVAEISALARSKGILCVVDGAQAAGAIKVNVKELGCHAYATSGHKWLMGPKGTGLLYIAKDAQDRIRPMQFDSSYNTYNDTNGTQNLPCILGLSKAIEYLESVGISKIEEHNLALRNRLFSNLSGLTDISIVSPPPGRLASPMLAAILPDQIDRKAFVKMLLDKHKLSIRPTHDPFGFNGIRFSMHIFNTEKEVDHAAEIVRKELAA